MMGHVLAVFALLGLKSIRSCQFCAHVAAHVPMTLSISLLQSTRIHAAFRQLRKLAREGGSHGTGTGSGAASGGSGGRRDDTATAPASTSAPGPAVNEHALASEIKQLRAQLQQRDNEIAILVNMVKQAGKASVATPSLSHQPSQSLPPSSSFSASGSGFAPTGSTRLMATPVVTPGTPHSVQSSVTMMSGAPIAAVGAMLASSEYVDPAILADRDRAMDYFMATYPRAQAINDNKELLKEKFAQAKGLADRVNGARDAINRIKKAIEVRRMERAVQSVAELKDADSDAVAAAVAAMPPDDEETALKGEMDASKKAYHESFQVLRDTKAEIERIQRVFEAGKLRLHADFESW